MKVGVALLSGLACASLAGWTWNGLEGLLVAWMVYLAVGFLGLSFIEAIEHRAGSE